MFGKRKITTREELRSSVREAIQTEKDFMDFYRLAAARMFNQRARLTFKLLSNEERAHALTFYKAYPGKDLPPFDDLMAEPPDPQTDWWQDLRGMNLGDFDEKKALALAIDRETALEERLRARADAIDDPQVREVFLSNAESTHRHLEVIRQDYEVLFS